MIESTAMKAAAAAAAAAKQLCLVQLSWAPLEEHCFVIDQHEVIQAPLQELLANC